MILRCFRGGDLATNRVVGSAKLPSKPNKVGMDGKNPTCEMLACQAELLALSRRSAISSPTRADNLRTSTFSTDKPALCERYVSKQLYVGVNRFNIYLPADKKSEPYGSETMPNQVVILHGWSDTSRSFHPLADFLAATGRVVSPLWLGDYISLDDDVRIPDVAKQLHAVLRERIGNGTIQVPFDMVVHSTGGLVVREWLATYYSASPANVPIRRLLMLAPANYGSKLASMGQSLLGRVLKGWDNWFHTGKEMLNALELSSPYLWDLVERDQFTSNGAGPGLYGDGRVWPFVIVGTHPYPNLLRQIVNEDGADGTVRVAAANLNTVGVTLDFTSTNEDPIATPWARYYQGTFPLAVLQMRTHGSIIDPNGGDISSETPQQKQLLADLILQALNCRSQAEYETIANSWVQIAEQAVSATDSRFHQFEQLNVYVIDDEGNPVEDYFLEFAGPSTDARDDATVYFQRSVLEDVHTNTLTGARRCLYADRNNLLSGFYPRIAQGQPRILTMSISANPPGKNVRYFSSTVTGAKGSYKLHDEAVQSERWLKRNTTHFVKIKIPRQPLSQVFTVATYA
jgi:pimeloyl-ACP methyl ester carboxylesterase